MGRRAVARARAAEAAGDAAALGSLERIIAEARARRERTGEILPFELPIVVAAAISSPTRRHLPLVNFPATFPPSTADRVAADRGILLASLHRSSNLTGPGYVADPEWSIRRGVTPPGRVVDAAEARHGRPAVRLDVRHLQCNGTRRAGSSARVDPGAGRTVGTLVPPARSCIRRLVPGRPCAMAWSFWEAGYPRSPVMNALTLTQKLSQDELLAAMARRHEPAVVDRNGRLEAVGSNAVDSQLVESIEVANAEIARTFGVMPSLVNVRAGDSLTYSTTEGEFAKWLKLGLGAVLMRLEAGFSELRPHGQHVRADTAELLRTDLAARYAAYSTALGRWLTLAEVRAAESLAPAPPDAFPAELSPPSAPPSSPLSDPSGVFP